MFIFIDYSVTTEQMSKIQDFLRGMFYRIHAEYIQVLK